MLIAIQEDVPIAHLMHGSTVLQDFIRGFVLVKTRKGGATGPLMFMFWLLHARRYIRCRLALKKQFRAYINRRRRYIQEIVSAWNDCDDLARSFPPGEVSFLEFAVCFVPREEKRAVVVQFRRLAMRLLRDDLRQYTEEMKKHHENFYYCVTEAFKKLTTGCFQVLRLFLLDVLLPSKFRPKLAHDGLRIVDLLRTLSHRDDGSHPDEALTAFVDEKIIRFDDQDRPKMIKSILEGKCCQMKLFSKMRTRARAKFPWFASSRAKLNALASLGKRQEKSMEDLTKVPISILETKKVVQSPKQKMISELLNLTHDDWYKHRFFQGTVHVHSTCTAHVHPDNPFCDTHADSPSKLLAVKPPRAMPLQKRSSASVKPPVPRFKRRGQSAALPSPEGCSDKDEDVPPPLPISTMAPSMVVLVPRENDENFIAPMRLVLRPQLPSQSHSRYYGSPSDPFPTMKRALSARGVQL